MKNTLKDLNNHLFAQIERLGDEDLTGDNLTSEINRTGAIVSVATQIIANGSLVLKAESLRANALSADVKIPNFLEG